MNRDPYRYFRIEAGELLEGLSQGLLELERGANQNTLKQLLRHAHTLKGAARVVKLADLGELAHRLEDVLVPHRESGAVDRKGIDQALALLDEMHVEVRVLGGSPMAERTAQQVPGSDGVGSEKAVRVAIEELDSLFDGVFQASVQQAALDRALAEVAQARAKLGEIMQGSKASRTSLADQAEAAMSALEQAHRSVAECSEQLKRRLDDSLTAASQLRLVPAHALLNDIERAARDAARSLDKEVDVRFRGADTHLDAHVLAGLRKALVHVVTNSVAHGIERPKEREQMGKARVGSVEIQIERRGHRVVIWCRDDGRGIDLESVRRVASERGLVTREEAFGMDEKALTGLLLHGGVSTTPDATSISGRGVGLETVRHEVQQLKGEIELSSVAGKGTTVQIVAPLAVSALPALALGVEDTWVLVPLDSVKTTLRVSDEDICRTAETEGLLVDGRIIPFLPLGRALQSPANEPPSKHTIVVLKAEGREAAIGVDRLGGVRNIVIRGVPEHARVLPVVSGATLDSEGVPQLVLGVAELIEAALVATPFLPGGPRREVPPLLIIDDSLTTRMLEQSILESAGFLVDSAISGEEGLEKARRRRYGVFVVDVEMPGMSGFEFIAQVSADPTLRGTPAILVTSRSDPADKRRGQEVGARAYIVKSEFNQAMLLETIRSLVA